MKRYTTSILTLTAIAVVLAGTMWLERPHCENGATPVSKLSAGAMIETIYPQRRDFFMRLHWFGKVESKRIVKIKALVAGRITAVKMTDGTLARRGKVLFTLGGSRVTHTMEALRQRVVAIDRQVSIARSMAQIKQDAVAEKMAKKEELLALQEHLAQLSGELATAKQKLAALQDAIHVRARIGGVFTNRKVSAGQEVQKGDDLAEIISQSHIYIVATLFPNRDAELEKKRVAINLPGGNSIQGTIISVLPHRTAEGASIVWIEGPDLARALRPGQTVTGMVVFSAHKRALTIPQSAMVRDEEERAYVFVKNSSGYRKQPVETGIAADGMVEITSGLKWRDEVVVRGAYELFYRDFKKMYKVAD